MEDISTSSPSDTIETTIQFELSSVTPNDNSNTAIPLSSQKTDVYDSSTLENINDLTTVTVPSATLSSDTFGYSTDIPISSPRDSSTIDDGINGSTESETTKIYDQTSYSENTSSMSLATRENFEKTTESVTEGGTVKFTESLEDTQTQDTAELFDISTDGIETSSTVYNNEATTIQTSSNDDIRSESSDSYYVTTPSYVTINTTDSQEVEPLSGDESSESTTLTYDKTTDSESTPTYDESTTEQNLLEIITGYVTEYIVDLVTSTENDETVTINTLDKESSSISEEEDLVDESRITESGKNTHSDVTEVPENESTYNTLDTNIFDGTTDNAISTEHTNVILITDETVLDTTQEGKENSVEETNGTTESISTLSLDDHTTNTEYTSVSTLAEVDSVEVSLHSSTTNYDMSEKISSSSYTSESFNTNLYDDTTTDISQTDYFDNEIIKASTVQHMTDSTTDNPADLELTTLFETEEDNTHGNIHLILDWIYLSNIEEIKK